MRESEMLLNPTYILIYVGFILFPAITIYSLLSTTNTASEKYIILKSKTRRATFQTTNSERASPRRTWRPNSRIAQVLDLVVWMRGCRVGGSVLTDVSEDRVSFQFRFQRSKTISHASRHHVISSAAIDVPVQNIRRFGKYCDCN
jgi:hypothetical protein